MENGTPNGETAAQQPLENTTNAVTTPPQVNVDVEAIRKEAEQARMRENQLKNELEKLKSQQEAERLEKLKENEDYKALYEQSQAELDRQRDEREAGERNSKLSAEKDTVLSEYPEAVKKIAEATGLVLTDDTEEAKTALKAKLDNIAENVGTTAQVTPNNTRPVTNEKSRDELIKEYRQTGDRRAMDAAIADLSFVKPFTNQ